MRLKAIKIGDNRAWSSTLSCRKRLLSKEACAFGGQLDLHINLLFLRSSDVHTQQWWWASRNPRSKSPENVHEVPTIAACRNFKKQAKYTFRFLAVLDFVGCFCYSAGMKARHQSLWSILTASIVLVRKKNCGLPVALFRTHKEPLYLSCLFSVSKTKVLSVQRPTVYNPRRAWTRLTSRLAAYDVLGKATP